VSLTGIPLILLAACATAGALAATVLAWPRWGRRRYLIRPAGVLLTEALLTATVGLAANRSQQFYPSWAALFATSDPGPASYHTTAGSLDSWLAARPDPQLAQTFPWRPVGWSGWRLAAPPTVTVPAGYSAHPGWRYSAVLVVARAADAWPVPALTGPTVLVTVTTTARTGPATLAVTLPGELGVALRVTPHRWALVTSPGDTALARRAVTAGRGRYPAVAFVGTPAPTGIRTAKTVTAMAAGVDASYFPAKGPVTGSLRAALTWAAAQTPPPLAASAPEPTYLPVQPKRSHSAGPGTKRAPHPPGRHAPGATPHPAPSAPTPSGGTDGSGQPRP
jgi:hypothetical protein